MTESNINSKASLHLAEAMAAFDGLVDEETEAHMHFLGSLDILPLLDARYGEKGRVIYE